MQNRNQIVARWKRIALATLSTAKRLRDSDDCRSCASRAYYAVYQATTAVCIAHGDAQHFPQGWNNPSHDQLPELVANNGDLPINVRQYVKSALRQLRMFRENADYRVGITVDAQISRKAVILASTVFARLEVGDDNN